MTTSSSAQHQPVSVRETLTSIIIAFALAFVFRAFVIEAFVIPTGSMAPTLMGAHMRFQSPESGYDWPVDTWKQQGANGASVPFHGTVVRPIEVNDPMTGDRITATAVGTKTGDRILVLKYQSLFGLGPTRFDAIVFKDPADPQTNFIKRLIGLPGEQIALVDGDIFVRTPAEDPDMPDAGSTWEQPGWKIARKYEADAGRKSTRGLHLQASLWQPVYSSEFAPLNTTKQGASTAFRTPWQGTGGGWDVSAASYRYEGSTATTLRWDHSIRPVTDRNPYNQTSSQPGSWVLPSQNGFPVSDVRMRCGIEPDAVGLEVSAVINARGHVFRARFADTTVAIDVQGPDGLWKTAVAGGTLSSPIAPGRITNVEFWHVDQALHVFVDGERIASHEYDWTPADRIMYTTGRSLSDILSDPDLTRQTNPFAAPALYVSSKPAITWNFSGGALTLHRVGLDRDLFYRPSSTRQSTKTNRAITPGWSTHPGSTRTFAATQYMACGDNSANSSDGRMWVDVDEWVQEIDQTPGIVPARLVIGKAFFVYFPSLQRGAIPVPSPDFGRLRWIW